MKPINGNLNNKRMKSKLTGKLILLHINVHFVRAKIYFEVKRIIIRMLILTYESHIQEKESRINWKYIMPQILEIEKPRILEIEMPHKLEKIYAAHSEQHVI